MNSQNAANLALPPFARMQAVGFELCDAGEVFTVTYDLLLVAVSGVVACVAVIGRCLCLQPTSKIVGQYPLLTQRALPRALLLEHLT